MDEGFIQLKWNTHQLALLDTLSALRDKQVYTDVTLSCGDHFYPAHRLVLSGCSTFFAKTLAITSCRAPVLLLHGIDQSTLEHLLMFMYDGQVTISRNDLEKLVKAAQWLGVKGLDTAEDKHRENEVADERQDPSQLLERWREHHSGHNNANTQPETLEQGMKFKNMTNLLQKDEDSCEQSSKSGSQSLEEQSNQETNTPAVPDSEKSHSGHDHFFLDDCLSNQTEDSSFSFKGWEDNGTCPTYDFDDVTVKDDKADETNEDDSNSQSDSAEPNTRKEKENTVVAGNKRSLKCKHCRRSFKIRKNLAMHLRIYHDNTENYCYSCHMQFISKKEYQSHMKIHTAKKLYPCCLCSFVSHSIAGLKKHVHMHQGTLSEPVVLITRLNSLEKAKHSSEESQNLNKEAKHNSKASQSAIPKIKKYAKKVTCPICMCSFKHKEFLENHLGKGCKKINKTETGFQCPMCQYTSNRLRSVKDHMCCHTGTYRFRCSHCQYQCNRNHILQDHMRKRHPEVVEMK